MSRGREIILTGGVKITISRLHGRCILSPQAVFGHAFLHPPHPPPVPHALLPPSGLLAGQAGL